MNILSSTLLSLTLCVQALALHAQTDPIWPDADWEEIPPTDVGMDPEQLRSARDYALTGDGAGVITRHGRLVMKWGDITQKFDLKSSSKSFGSAALGLSIDDGKFGLDDPAADLHPTMGIPPTENRDTGWIPKITIRQLATHTAGFDKNGGYTSLLFEPGSRWDYSDGGPNWLAECVTLAYQQDIQALLFNRLFQYMGITSDDLHWRAHAYRDRSIQGITRREFGSGVHADVDAMARFGYLFLREGQWQDQRLLSADFTHEATHPQTSLVGLPVNDPEQFQDASAHYGLLWWNNADQTLANVPKDAFWSWGLYDSLILVIPSLDIVVARAGKSWERREGSGHYEVLRPFFEPIVASVAKSRSSNAAPYPQSPVIDGIEWAEPETIIRKARGGDNWPITWAKDDHLYTAYGDGFGFEPKVDKKLSMGLCRIEGGPDSFEGFNIRSPSFETTGDGARAPKTSGLLMIDGVLYALARNSDNARLGWSSDHGQTWDWADWRFDVSFGYPTFLNFGKNYEGARDDNVYIYSHDHDSAYERSDAMVLARVHRARLREKEAYEFYTGMTPDGPGWSRDVHDRAPVFTNPGACYRSSVSYHTDLRRYLWVQIGLGEDTRFAGGLAIYDAPQPWGPWTTVFHTYSWDVGPGETACLPTKWMNMTDVHLVFSGDDAFSVRNGTLRWVAPSNPESNANSVQ